MIKQSAPLLCLFVLATALAAALTLLSGCRAPASSSSQEEAESTSWDTASAASSQPAPESASDIPQEASLAPPPPAILTLTIPEGYTLARIGMTLEEKGVCTAGAFIAAAQQGDFSAFPLVAAQGEDPNRCFALEGYLFPDTYEIYENETPDAIIRKMLSHTERRITPELRGLIEDSGYTLDQIITLASIIEKEALGVEAMGNISSVLHNRLAQGMQLQCDVTIVYVEGAIKPFITGDVNRYNSYYNTYKCPALPAGAICNPGMEAIRAALHPTDTDYLFFVTDANNRYYWSATWAGHEENVATARSVKSS